MDRYLHPADRPSEVVAPRRKGQYRGSSGEIPSVKAAIVDCSFTGSWEFREPAKTGLLPIAVNPTLTTAIVIIRFSIISSLSVMSSEVIDLSSPALVMAKLLSEKCSRPNEFHSSHLSRHRYNQFALRPKRQVLPVIGRDIHALPIARGRDTVWQHGRRHGGDAHMVRGTQNVDRAVRAVSHINKPFLR